MIKGFQIDVARQIERPELLLESIRHLGRCGYNLCMLYLEDAYDYPEHRTIGRKHAYSAGFMQKIYKVCQGTKMELVPVIPSLGHCAYITSKPGYEKYDEGFEFGTNYGTLIAGHEETYKLMTGLFKDWCNHIPGKYIHVGLDESPHMGLSHIHKNDAEKLDALALFVNHCQRLNTIVKDLGRKMIMWGDMFYYFPEAIGRLDRDIIVADWYYYSFNNTPRIEAFNFSEINLSGDLKKAGFEVWGIPSVWPNYPFPDIFDRLANLRSWQCYGEKCKIDGIVNTDWENSLGFFSISELLYATFERMCQNYDEKLLPQALTETVENMTGVKPNDEFVQDLLNLGIYQLAGHADRILMTGSVMTMVSTAQPRIEEFRQKAEKLREMFIGIDVMIEKCRLAEGRILLKSVSLCHRTLFTVWNSCWIISDVYSSLIENKEIFIRAGARLDSLAKEIFSLNRDYSDFWGRVRFDDDKQKSISPWAVCTMNELHALAEIFNSQLTLRKNPMFMRPLLELELECAHPALPILDIEVHWAGGTIQKSRQIMIKFESAYAVPDKYWRQYASIPLEKNQLPETIVFISAHYGQIGIRRVKITWQGVGYEYAVHNTDGRKLIYSSDALLLGPVGATSFDSTHRPDSDKACYRLIC
ncbi:MAG: family 20 glycosylhydrolase [Paludibacteraceae bacterium]